MVGGAAIEVSRGGVAVFGEGSALPRVGDTIDSTNSGKWE
jgi:hypothetical protein